MDVFVTGRDEAKITVQGEPGGSLMASLRDAGLVEAMCGGQAACATCHVYLEAPWLDRIGVATGQEADMLDSSLERTDRSRLSCQIVLDDSLNGLEITIAPAEN